MLPTPAPSEVGYLGFDLVEVVSVLRYGHVTGTAPTAPGVRVGHRCNRICVPLLVSTATAALARARLRPEDGSRRLAALITLPLAVSGQQHQQLPGARLARCQRTQVHCTNAAECARHLKPSEIGARRNGSPGPLP